jgi:Antitoxin MazE-like
MKHRTILQPERSHPLRPKPGFAEECRCQSLVVATADAADRDLQDFMEAALADLDDEAAE